jgi:hypothetical protein
MWIEKVDAYGKYVEWATTSEDIRELLRAAIDYADQYDFHIEGVSTRMGQTHDETILSATFQ